MQKDSCMIKFLFKDCFTLSFILNSHQVNGDKKLRLYQWTDVQLMCPLHMATVFSPLSLLGSTYISPTAHKRLSLIKILAVCILYSHLFISNYIFLGYYIWHLLYYSGSS